MPPGMRPRCNRLRILTGDQKILQSLDGDSDPPVGCSADSRFNSQKTPTCGPKNGHGALTGLMEYRYVWR